MEFSFCDIIFQGVQQDLKLALLPPVICAIFRLVFIKVWGGKKLGEWPKEQLKESFRYGFWWGMDFNAKIYLASFVIVTLPSLAFASWFEISNSLRIGIYAFYCWILYCAFMGKMIFYYHYHDVYNRNVWLGKTADKGNLVDIFFNQNHGGWILFGMLPYTALCVGALMLLGMLPSVSAIEISNVYAQYGFAFLVFVIAVLLYYWFHFGGTFKHRDKPEWDEIPAVVKQNVFLSKATMDDLVSLKIVIKHPVPELFQHNDEESKEIFLKEEALQKLLPEGKLFNAENIKNGFDPLELFSRQAKGPRIKKPKRIFIMYGESHAQAPFDETFSKLHIMDASKKLRENEHTFSINNCLSAGLVSQISLGGMLLGIFDADIELNERMEFWQGTTVTAFAAQLKKLGYSTHFWYGGKTTWGSLMHFTPAVGFDTCKGGPEFCPKDAPATWLGVYDHIFLEETAKLIKESRDEYELHFVYTTSNHGPYDMPYWDMGFDTEKVMPDIPEALKNDKMNMRRFAGVWYADQALNKFIDEMKEKYPDSLFVVTGDHASALIPYNYGLLNRSEQSIRETMLPCFHIHHRELTRAMFAENTIGSHMNLLPTLMELIAPKGFEYYSVFPSLLEKIDHVVSPYAWVEKDFIGNYQDKMVQPTEISAEAIPTENGKTKYDSEREALLELTSWTLRHPDVLKKR